VYLWGLYGIIWGYIYIKVGKSIEKWEFFVGFWLLFCVGMGGFLESLEGVEGVKGFNLWSYGSIYINFLSWKE
jgi:hypothetical protein